MPITRERRALYPADWRKIAKGVKDAAGWRCAECGVAHGAVGAWDRFGRWLDEGAIHHLKSDEGEYRYGEFPKMVTVVITVHHQDQNPANNAITNLVPLCQRHHLALDRGLHSKNAAETRRRKRLEAREQ